MKALTERWLRGVGLVFMVGLLGFIAGLPFGLIKIGLALFEEGTTVYYWTWGIFIGVSIALYPLLYEKLGRTSGIFRYDRQTDKENGK